MLKSESRLSLFVTLRRPTSILDSSRSPPSGGPTPPNQSRLQDYKRGGTTTKSKAEMRRNSERLSGGDEDEDKDRRAHV